jgi:hypothetical protein
VREVYLGLLGKQEGVCAEQEERESSLSNHKELNRVGLVQLCGVRGTQLVDIIKYK